MQKPDVSLPCALLTGMAMLIQPALSAANEAHSPNVPDNAYLFSYFTGNGEDGLHLAWSRDGLKWEALNDGRSYLRPEVGESKLMRDPCLLRGPDGIFHMVWTTAWQGKTIGYASSKDLINWSPQKAVPVMAHEPTVKNCWAPEVAYDNARKCFMIFWASTLPEKFTETWFDGKNDNNHRIYVTTTKDFETFTPTELFFNPGFNVIDSTILTRNGKAYMIFKEETKFPKAVKNLQLAVADRLAGPYQVQPKPINPPGAWVEGPTTLQIDEHVYLYFDVYTKKHYGALRSPREIHSATGPPVETRVIARGEGDMENWEDITSQISFPRGARHGTALAVPGNVVKTLLDHDATKSE